MVLGGLVLIALGFALHEAWCWAWRSGPARRLPMLLGVARSRSLYRARQGG